MSELFSPDDVGRLVVDAVLLVDKPFPAIWLSRTTRPDQTFDTIDFAERGAIVSVSNRLTGSTVDYTEVSNLGEYLADPQNIVEPLTTYDLRVVTATGERLTATTTTPASFKVVDWLLLESDAQTIRQRMRTYEELGDSVYFAAENQLIYSDGLLEARFTRPAVTAFQVGIQSLDRDSEFVIDPEFFEDEDFADLQRDITSPPLEALDGSVRLPWLAIYFQGRYRIRVLALDSNAYDLIRSTPDENGGPGFGGNLGDGFEQPIFHVDGGIGLFGSAAVDSVGLFIRPRP